MAKSSAGSDNTGTYHVASLLDFIVIPLLLRRRLSERQRGRERDKSGARERERSEKGSVEKGKYSESKIDIEYKESHTIGGATLLVSVYYKAFQGLARHFVGRLPCNT